MSRRALAPAERQAQSTLSELLIFQEKTEIQIHRVEPSNFKISVYKGGNVCGLTKPPEKGQGLVSVLFPAVPRRLGQGLGQSRGSTNPQGPIPTSASDCRLPGTRGTAVPAKTGQHGIVAHNSEKWGRGSAAILTRRLSCKRGESCALENGETCYEL